MKRVAVHNLGCKVNGYELDVMVQRLKESGYELVPFEEQADVYVINTCTVTNIADRKSRQMIHKAKHQNPDSIVVAVGCYVETDEKRIEEDSAVDLAIGNNKKGRIAEILAAYLEEHTGEKSPAVSKGSTGARDSKTPDTSKTLSGRTMEDLAKKPSFESMQLTEPGHTRAYIKIQDGCNQFCSYCIIPYARGRIRSRDPEEIVEEIIGLAAEGVREVVLTGIHICSYGKDKGEEPETALLSLLRRIQMIRGIERIRLGSLEPRIMTENFVRGIAGLSKLCPHFHLSLQSGCDATLRRMNRHYTAEEYYAGVTLLRKFFDRPAITTDVIVGFAGETPEEFAASKAFLAKVNFYEIHVFKYSMRHGTAAAKMPDQQTPETKSERSDELLELTKGQSDVFRRSFIGEEEELLLEEMVEQDGERYWTGHTKRYVQGLVREAELSRVFGEKGREEGGYEGLLVRGRFTAMACDPHYLLMNDVK